MKKVQKFLLSFICLSLISWSIQAQTFLDEDFNTGLPTGWVTSSASGVAAPWAVGSIGSNNLGSSSSYLFVNSDANGNGNSMNETITSASFSATGATQILLEFDQYINTVTSGETFDVDVWDGTTWQNVYSYTAGANIGSFTTPDAQSIDITAFANPAMQLRFTYTDNNNWAWYWAVDNVEVSGFNCAIPTANSSTNSLTPTTAEVSWVENGTSTSWRVEWDTAGYTAGTARNSTVVMTDTFLNVTGLTAETAYDWGVYALCSATDSSLLATGSFTTPCAAFTPNYNEDFTSFLPNCWDEADDGSILTGPTNIGAGTWTNQSGGAAFGNSARINLFTNNRSDWLLSPAFDLTGGPFELVVNAAVTDWNSTTSPDNMGSDDSVQVAISTDNGVTWSSIYVWDVNNEPIVTFSSYVIDLTPYNNQTVQFGILATDGPVDDSEDYDFHIGNFEVRTPPACAAPTANAVTAISDISATFSWIENGTATEYFVEYDTAGFAVGTGRNKITVTTDTFLTVNNLSVRTDYDWYVKAVCAPMDSSANAGNSFSTLFFTPAAGVNCGSGFPQTVFSEEFDNNNAGWTGDVGSGNGNWEIPDDATSPNTGADNAYSGSNYMNYEASNTSVNQGSIVSPAIDLTNGATDAELSFWLHAYGDDMGTLNVGVSTSATGPFTNVFTTSGEIQTSGSDPWLNVGVNLAAYLGQTIYLEFTQIDDQGDFNGDMSIDLVEVSTCVACPDPSNLSASAITANSADLSWIENGNSTSWVVEYGIKGFTPGNGTTVSASNDTLNVSGLTTNATYDFYVQTDCGTDSSGVIGPYTFTVGTLPLAGSYTIDSTTVTGGTNFESFDAFGSALNTLGVSAAVDVSVAANTYNEQLSIGEYAGASATNTVTIDGSNVATLTHDQSIRNSTITLEGASWVTVKNMTIAATGGTDSWGIHLLDSAHNITIDSNVITLPVGFTADVAGIISSSSEDSDVGSGSNAYDITISNNTITGGENGMSMRGDFSSTNRNANITITNNIMTDTDDRGIYIAGWDNVVISGNTVNTPNSSFSDAFYSSDLENFTIDGNYFSGNDNGMDMDDSNFDNAVSSNSTISNNMVIGGDDGIDLDDVENVNIFHNTFYAEDWAMDLNDDLNLDIRNNIFYSVDDHALNSDDGVVHTMDYNIFYTGGTADLFEFGTSNYADLAAFQAGEPTMNTNSLEGDPIFLINGIDLHVRGALANDAGDNSVGITVDIDGDSRPIPPSTTVDIGADEFTPPPCTSPLNLTATVISSDSVGLSWSASNTPTAPEYQISYGLSGFTAGNGTQLVVTTTTDTLLGLMVATDYDVFVRAICNPGSDTSGWSSVTSFTTNCPSAFSAPFVESFDGSGQPNCWTQTSVSSGDSWEFGTGVDFGPTAPVRPDAFGNIGEYANIDFSDDPDTTSLITPVIDVSSLSNPRLTFFYNSQTDDLGINPFNRLIVDYWDGSVWVNFAVIDSLTPAGWTKYSFNAAAYIYNSTFVQFRFSAQEGGAAIGGSGLTFNQDLMLDEVVVEEEPTCADPSFPSTSNVFATTADVSWVDNAGASSWFLEWDTAGYQLGSARNSQVVSVTNATISSLIPDTDYEWNARAICAVGDSSIWVGQAFRTTVSCPEPTANSALGVTNATAILTWTENAFATEWEVEWDTAGFALGTGRNVIQVLNDTFLNLTGLTPSTDYDWYVRAVCGINDSSLWTAVESFTTDCSPFTTPFVENFDATTQPNCWSQTAVLDGPWVFGGPGFGWNTQGCPNVPTDNTGNSGSFAALDFSGSGVVDVSLVLPTVDVSALTRPWLSFDFFMCGSGYTPINILYVDAFDGTSWTVVDSIQEQTNGWKNYEFDVSSSTFGSSLLKLRLRASSAGNTISMFQGDQAIDNVSIDEAPACIDPTNLTITNVTTTSVDFGWTDNNSTTPPNWLIEYGAPGFTLGSGTSNPVTTNPVTVSSLMPGTTYEIYVRSACSSTDSSAWVGPIAFNTFCNPFTATYTENFDALTAPENPICFNSIVPAGIVVRTVTSTDHAVAIPSGTNALEIDCGPATATGGFVVLPEFSDLPSGLNRIRAQYAFEGLATGNPDALVVGVLASPTDTASFIALDSIIGPRDVGAGFTEISINLDDVASIGSRTTLAYKYVNGGGSWEFFIDDFSYEPIPLPYYPIGTINTEDATSGVADSANVECVTSGTIVGYDRRGGGYELAIVDMSSGSQEGITLFEFSDVSGYTNPTVGDSIMVYGEVDQFNGLTQFRPDSIILITSGTAIPTPIVSNVLNESTESKLISMTDKFVLLDPSSGGSFNAEAVSVINPSDTILLRVDSDSDIDDSLAISTNAWVAGDTICGLVGVGSQRDFNSPFLEFYRVFPNSWADITICKNTTGIDEATVEEFGNLSIYPNPTNGQFTIQTSGLKASNALLQVRDVSGRVVLEDNIAQSNQAFSRDYNLDDPAKGLYFISIIDGDEQKTIKLIVQ